MKLNYNVEVLTPVGHGIDIEDDSAVRTNSLIEDWVHLEPVFYLNCIYDLCSAI